MKTSKLLLYIVNYIIINFISLVIAFYSHNIIAAGLYSIGYSDSLDIDTQKGQVFNILSNLKPPYEFKLVSEVELEDKSKRYRFIQYYNNIPIWNSILTTNNKIISNASIISAKFLVDINNDIMEQPDFEESKLIDTLKIKLDLVSKTKKITKVNIDKYIYYDFYNSTVDLGNNKSKLVYLISFTLENNQGKSKQITNPTVLVDVNSGDILKKYDALTLDLKYAQKIISESKSSNEDNVKKVNININNKDYFNFTTNNSNLVNTGQAGAIREAFFMLAKQVSDNQLNNDKSSIKNNQVTLENAVQDKNNLNSKDTVSIADNEDIKWIFNDELTALNPVNRYFNNPERDGSSINNIKDYCHVNSNISNAGLFTQAFYNLIITKYWDDINVFNVYSLANQMYWSNDTSFEDAACGIYKAAKDFNYNTQHVIEAFAKVGVNASCSKEKNNLVGSVELANKYKIDTFSDKVNLIQGQELNVNTLKNLDDNYSFKLISGHQAETIGKRYKFKQYYKDILISDAQITTIKPSIGCLRLGDPVMGRVYTNIDKDLSSVKPNITIDKAYEIAKNATNTESNIKIVNLRHKLVIKKFDNKLLLVYMVDFFKDNPVPSQPMVAIDAMTGEVLGVVEQLVNENVTVTSKGGNTVLGTMINNGTIKNGKQQQSINLPRINGRCYLNNKYFRVIEWDDTTGLNANSDSQLGYNFPCDTSGTDHQYKSYTAEPGTAWESQVYGAVISRYYLAEQLFKMYEDYFPSDNILNDFVEIRSITVPDGGRSYYMPWAKVTQLYGNTWSTRLFVTHHELGHHVVSNNSQMSWSTPGRSLNEGFASITAHAVLDGYMKYTWLFHSIRKTKKSEYEDSTDTLHANGDIFVNAYKNLAKKWNNDWIKAYRPFVLANQVYWDDTKSFDQYAEDVCTAAGDLKLNTDDVKQVFKDAEYDLICPQMEVKKVTITSIVPDNGTSNTDFITDVTTVTINGSTSGDVTGLKVQISNSTTNKILGAAVINTSGNWQFELKDLAVGKQDISVVLIDASNIVKSDNVIQTVEVTAKPVITKSVAILSINPDTGMSNTDFKTDATTITLMGNTTGEVTSLKVQLSNTTTNLILGIVEIDTAGKWQLELKDLAIGIHNVSAVLIDSSNKEQSEKVNKSIEVIEKVVPGTNVITDTGCPPTEMYLSCPRCAVKAPNRKCKLVPIWIEFQLLNSNK